MKAETISLISVADSFLLFLDYFDCCLFSFETYTQSLAKHVNTPISYFVPSVGQVIAVHLEAQAF